ncbi:MAG: hypothetical protein ABI625_22800, partial [bacterium]
DTLRVVGKRVRTDDLRQFDARRRRGVGTFFEAESIKRLQITETTRLFGRIPGVQPIETRDGMALRIRGETCAKPHVYIDGALFPIVFSVRELDAIVHPEEIRGFEFYTAGTAPMEFSPGMSCGSVVIWTSHGRRGR